jgi:hypothetical protein
MSLRSLTSRPVTGIPNGPRPPPGWFPEPEDARPSAPGSNPGRAGRALTIRGGNGSHTPRPGVQIRAAASVRSESSRNGIAPGPTTLVSVPSREAPHHPRSSLRGVGRARRRGLSARRTRGLRPPAPCGSRVLPLGRRVPYRSGITPGTAASSGGGFHRETKAGITRPGPSIVAPNTCRRRQQWDRLASQAKRSTPGREPGRSLTPSPTKSGDFPRSFFGWSSPRGLAPTPRPGRDRRGCRTVCWRVLMPSRAEQGS